MDEILERRCQVSIKKNPESTVCTAGLSQEDMGTFVEEVKPELLKEAVRRT